MAVKTTRDTHQGAFITPRSVERPIVNLLNLIDKLILKHLNGEEVLAHADKLLVEEVVIPLLRAAKFYLNFDNGMRLDNGLLSEEIDNLCARCGVDSELDIIIS